MLHRARFLAARKSRVVCFIRATVVGWFTIDSDDGD